MSMSSLAAPALPYPWLDQAAELARAHDLADLHRRCEQALAALMPNHQCLLVELQDEPALSAHLLEHLRRSDQLTSPDETTGYLPVRAGTEFYGYIAVTPPAWSPEQAQMLAILAAIVGPTAHLLKERARDEAERQRRELVAAAQRLRGLLDLDTVLGQIHALAASFLCTDHFLVVLRGENDWVELAYAAQHHERIRERQFWHYTTGLTGAVLQEGRLITTDNYLAECERRKVRPVSIKHFAPPLAWVGAPLSDGLRPFGVLTASSTDPHVCYSAEQVALLELLAHEAAVPLRNALFYSRAEEQARQLASLNRIGRIINSSLDPAQVPQLIMQQVQELLAVEEGSMLLRDENNGDLVFTYAGGPAGSRLLGQRLPPGVGIAGYVVGSGQSAIVNDTRSDERFYTEPDSSIGFVTRSILAVPLRGIDGVRGVIEVMNRKDDAPFTDTDRRLLEAVADQAVIALENASRFAQVDQALARRARELDQSNDQLRKILRLGNALRAEQRLDELLAQVARAVVESSGFRNAVVALVDRERTAHPYLRRMVAAGPAASEIARLQKARGPLTRLPALLRPESRRSSSTYLCNRHSTAYLDLWGGSDEVYQPESGSIRPGGWNPSDVLCCLMRNSRDELLGVLFVDQPEDEQLPSPDQVQILEILSNLAAVAIENASLYNQQQHNLRSMTALNGLGMAINSTLRSPAQIFALTTAGMVETTDAQAAAVFLIEPGRPEAVQVFTTGIPSDLGACDLPALAGRAIAGGRPVILNLPRLAGNDKYDDPDTWVAVPLRATSGALGAVCVGYVGTTLTEDDLERLVLFASQAAVAVESIRLFSALSEGRDRLASIMVSTHEGLLLIDAAAHVVVANPAFVNLTGLTTPEGLDLENLFERWQQTSMHDPEGWERLHTGIRAVVAGSEEFVHGQLERRSTTGQFLEWTALRAAGNQALTWPAGNAPAHPTLLVLRDITAAKEAERLRQDLTSMIIHDLRSPLASILTSIEMFFRGVSGEVNQVQREILTIAQASARQLLEMVNLLLDISRLEGGQMPLNRECLSVDQLTHRAVARLRALAENKRISVELISEPQTGLIYADGELMLRVLQNLLDNALKFTRTGGRIELLVGNQQAENKDEPAMVRFSVRDNGPGIAPQDQAKIFGKFSQAGERRGSGSGLGLTFCKLVVEAHGGRIWLESAPGLGSTFHFSVPAAALHSTK